MRRILLALVVMLVGGAVGIGIRLPSIDGAVAAPSGSVGGKVGVAVSSPTLETVDAELTRLVRAVTPSVVSITTEKRVRKRVSPMDPLEFFFGGGRIVEEKAKGMGSGVVVSSKGHVMTNHHVISGMEQIVVQLDDGRVEPAKLVGSDPQTDIAVLKIEGIAPALTFADSDQVKVGQMVLAVGNPFGFEETVTRGIVNAKGRAFSDSGVQFLQTDAAVNPGNSGGPLLNIRGEIIGINTAIYSKSGEWLGISFAVPSNVAKRSMESIIQSGRVRRGDAIGVSTAALSSVLARELGLPDTKGVVVIAVQRGSPADRAQFEVGDVIRAVNGKPVTGPQAWIKMISECEPGTKAELKVVRERKEWRVICDVAEAKRQ